MCATSRGDEAGQSDRCVGRDGVVVIAVPTMFVEARRIGRVPSLISKRGTPQRPYRGASVISGRLIGKRGDQAIAVTKSGADGRTT